MSAASSSITFGQKRRQRFTSFEEGIFFSTAHQMPLLFSIPQMHSMHLGGKDPSGL